jgi:hypothetical protein
MEYKMRCRNCNKKIVFAPLIKTWYHKRTKDTVCNRKVAEPR